MCWLCTDLGNTEEETAIAFSENYTDILLQQLYLNIFSQRIQFCWILEEPLFWANITRTTFQNAF
jgi:hypothetical protein